MVPGTDRESRSRCRTYNVGLSDVPNTVGWVGRLRTPPAAAEGSRTESDGASPDVLMNWPVVQFMPQGREIVTAGGGGPAAGADAAFR
jgi:hypothetical protein